MVYLYDSLQLAILLQQPCLFLLQGENVLCRLLQDGSLWEENRIKFEKVRDLWWKQKQTHSNSTLKATLLSFSPSLCGMSVLSDWNPALMLCIRRRSLLLAISLRIRLSWSRAVSGVRGMLARLEGNTYRDTVDEMCQNNRQNFSIIEN